MVEFTVASAVHVEDLGLPSVGMNVARLLDWENHMTLDRMKSSRKPVLADYSAIGDEYMDAGFSVIGLPPGETQYRIIFSSDKDANHAGDGGSFVLRWAGDAADEATITVEGGGVSNVVQGSKQITFDWSSTASSPSSDILVSNPNFADPPNSFTMIRTDEQAAYDAGTIWRTEAVASLANLSPIRFMEVQITNGSLQTTWADRPVSNNQSWRPGVPIEACIDLCNTLGQDMWICMPHMVDDDYFTQAATLVRDNLDTSLKCWIEYTNEGWNTGAFPQGGWLQAQADADWTTGLGSDRGVQWQAKRSTQMMTIWNTVFAGQLDRLVRVLGTWQTNTNWAVATMDAPLWQTYEPGSYVAPHTMHDVLAVTTYFGNATITNNAAQIDTWLQTSQQTAIDGMVPLVEADIDSKLATLATHALQVSSDGRDMYLVGYEGGNHLVMDQGSGTALYSGGQPTAAFDSLMRYLYRSAEMKAWLDRMMDGWKALGDRARHQCHYEQRGRVTDQTCFGLRHWIGDDNTVALGFDAWVTANPKWWQL